MFMWVHTLNISRSNVSKFALLKHFGCDFLHWETRSCLDTSEYMLKCVAVEILQLENEFVQCVVGFTYSLRSGQRCHP